MTRFKFYPEERLKSERLIVRLFEEGNSKGMYPLRFVWIHTPERVGRSPVRVAFAVSRRNFKSAVKRNKLKRRMREAWRLHKQELYQALAELDGQIALMVIYSGKEEKDFREIEKTVKRAIRKLPGLWLANP